MRRSKLEIQLNRDIREYKDKLWWGMTGRQIGFSLLGLIAGAGLYLLVSPLGTDLAVICCTAAIFPLFILGFFKWRGQPMEMFLKIWIRGNVMTNRFLPYRPDEPACFELVRSARQNAKKGKGNHEESHQVKNS